MSMLYQPLNYYAQPPTATDTCCGPACAGWCCAKPHYCVEPGCCSRVGACPCFCTDSATAFSLALCTIWIALPLLILSQALPDVFTYDYTYGRLPSSQLGMWQICAYYQIQVNNELAGAYSCTNYSEPFDVDAAYFGLGTVFSIMRVLTLVATAATLATAILASVRLAFQQRTKRIPQILNWTLVASAVLAVGTAATAWVLSMVLYSNFSSFWSVNYLHWISPGRGTAWAVLTAGSGLLLVAVPLHLVAHCCYQRKVRQQQSMDSTLSFATSYQAVAGVAPSPLAVQPSSPSPVEYRPVEVSTYLSQPPPTYDSVVEPAPPIAPKISYGPVVPAIYLTPGQDSVHESVYENI